MYLYTQAVRACVRACVCVCVCACACVRVCVCVCVTIPSQIHFEKSIFGCYLIVRKHSSCAV